MKTIREGLTFDDVLLVPKRSPVKSRKDVDTSTKLSKNISLNVPIVSSNMDTVTESAMAITLAQLGGIGIIHRFLTVDRQVEEILKVKRSESIIIESPYTLTEDRTLGDAQELMKDRNVHGLLILNAQGKLDGILTARDIQFETNPKTKVSSLMTPRAELVTAAPGISLVEAKKILHAHRIEKLPLIDKNWNLKGLITSNDLVKINKYPNATKDQKGRLRVGAAIGVKKGFIERTAALLEADVDVLVVDIAHGHSDIAINTVKELRKNFGDVEIIAGNVATAEGTRDLIKAGVDAVKVGVGPGSICITRIVTGSGVPQLTAIQDTVSVARKENIPIIADGGVRTSGDFTKALAAGASTVMFGSMLAGTDESPGVTMIRNGRKYKISRGMASFGASLGRKERESDTDVNDFTPEGVEAMVPYRGAAREIVSQLVGGLRSGISYCGALNLKEMQKNAEFIHMSASGMTESKPHDVDVLS